MLHMFVLSVLFVQFYEVLSHDLHVIRLRAILQQAQFSKYKDSGSVTQRYYSLHCDYVHQVAPAFPLT